MLFRIPIILLLLALLAPTAFGDDEVYVLHRPKPDEEEVRSTYTSDVYGFGFDLPEGFTFNEQTEDDVFTLFISLENYPLQVALTIEPLEEELTPKGYWKVMLERDPTIGSVVAYERGMPIDSEPGLLVRLEDGGPGGGHYLIMSMIFTKGTNGFFISVLCQDDYFFEEAPDFFDEIVEGFHFIEPDDEPVDETPDGTEKGDEETG